MDAEFARVLQECMENNRGAIIATVVEAKGSVPREAGAKMLIFDDGTFHGTVGGGAIENRVIEEARKMKGEKATRFLSYDLNKDLGMECGGEVKVYLEAIQGTRRLVVFGGGHIGAALYALAPLMGMRPVIVDERSDFCNKGRFPHADLYPLTPEEAVKALDLGPRDHAVIVTHRHKNDLVCLRLVLQAAVAYVGMIGSRRKVAHTFEKLKEEGVTQEQLDRVRAPIGLNLGGRSPGEIAIAIAAEVIAQSQGKALNGFFK
ncbi:MAG: XdhC/CoxI family protein [Planctomycetes bacterium]|nr:XdhC/CoxI family protein [Planctomycetota bacterium]